MTETNYDVELLDGSSFKIFKGVYNDFRSKAVSEYKFELEPLEYEEFIDAVEKGFLKCIVLKENLIPTAFLRFSCRNFRRCLNPEMGGKSAQKYGCYTY